MVAQYAAGARAMLAAHARRYWRHWALIVVIVLAFGTVGYEAILAPPGAFAPDTIVVIAPGTGVDGAAQELAQQHIISHPKVFRVLLALMGAHAIRAGTYRFAQPQNTYVVAQRLTNGTYGLPNVRITFTEGMTSREMAQKVAKRFPGISASDFISAAQPYEGYLFPDTYVFSPSDTAQSIVQTMRQTFQKQTATLQQEASTTGHSFADIVTMASLVQDEARTLSSQKMVAGILWNRIRIRMPLQVDAVFGYIFNRPTYSPSFADLSVDSPYNTYTHYGLPPGPIGNPGLNALTAAAFPAQTKDLYYLTGKDGQMHYARTYAQQLANQRRYLH